ncbi:MAG: glycerol-3-phosphate acyltransferase [Acidimicrobiia bacterium]
MTEAGILLLAFVLGSIPVANLISTRTRGVDLRREGTGTVSGTALYRVAGFRWLVIGGILDVAKGAAGPLLAGSDRPTLAALAGGVAIAGHNWSPFLRGQGGRGIGPALGALGVNAWPGIPVIIVPWLVGRALHESAVGAFVGQVLLTPALALLDGGSGALVGGAVALPMLIKRITSNGPPVAPGLRVYGHRLLFDRDPA